ncbi:transposase [Clostridioides difficile]|nr:transposase [Clostridioides difficile]MDO0129980.1 transposase [Clostridioides difficile]
MGRHLWNPSYFVATVSENTEEQIRKYINNQKKQLKLGNSSGKSL